jgi:type VI protein secretion system component Hcp
MQTSEQSECALGNPARGEGKFTGQISGTPTASAFEVVSGQQSAMVTYGKAVLVCENGQPGSASALVAGASVVVFGPMKSRGPERFELSATRILVAAPARANLRGNPAAVTATNVSSGMTAAGEQSRVDSSMGGQNRPGSSSLPGTIACSGLEFSVTVRDTNTGRPTGRPSVSPIVCRKPADQVAVQLTEEAMTGRRTASLTLSWQNQVAVKLTEAEVTGVQFKVDNGTQIVEVTFAYQRVELEHTPSGTKAAL